MSDLHDGHAKRIKRRIFPPLGFVEDLEDEGLPVPIKRMAVLRRGGFAMNARYGHRRLGDPYYDVVAIGSRLKRE